MSAARLAHYQKGIEHVVFAILGGFNAAHSQGRQVFRNLGQLVLQDIFFSLLQLGEIFWMSNSL